MVQACDVICSVKAKLQTQYRSAFLGNLLHSSLTTPWWTSHSLWSAPPETIKHYIYCTLMSKKCAVPQPFLYLADMIRTWFTSCYNINHCTDPYDEDIEGLTYCITGYINLCVDNVVSARTVACFLNNQPWMTTDIKALLNEKTFQDSFQDKGHRGAQAYSVQYIFFNFLSNNYNCIHLYTFCNLHSDYNTLKPYTIMFQDSVLCVWEVTMLMSIITY